MQKYMTERVLKRIQEASDDETTYEAQQQLKTVYHRLRSRNQLEQAYTLLSKGCKAQIMKGQVVLHASRTLDILSSPAPSEPFDCKLASANESSCS